MKSYHCPFNLMNLKLTCAFEILQSSLMFKEAEVIPIGTLA